MRRSDRLLAAAAVLVGAIALAVVLPLALAERERAAYMQERLDEAPDEAVRLAWLDDAVHESSGLAVSHAHPGILYTHNDSGDGPRFYAFDLDGRLLATWRVAGASATDWEDADLGPCPVGPDAACLYLGDIGDNARVRDVLTVWIVAEPEPAPGGGEVEPVGRLRFRYPDGAHDAEALALSHGGDLVVVTKGRTPTIRLYLLPAAALREAVAADTVITLPPGRVLPIQPDFRIGRAVTGASFDPSGSVLAVRTYTEIYFLRGPLHESVSIDTPSCWLGELEPAGEAIAFADDRTLLLTTEAARGRPAALTRVRCRGQGVVG